MKATEEEVVQRLKKLCDDLDKETFQLMRLRREVKASIKSFQRKKRLLLDAARSFEDVELHMLRRFLEVSRDNCQRVAAMFDERITELKEENGNSAFVGQEEQ